MKKFILFSLFMLMSAFSFSSIESSKPNVRLEGGLGYSALTGTTADISIMPEWRANINPNFDITFGPKINALAYYEFGTAFYAFGGIAEFETDFNIKVSNNTKFYVGLEAGVGVRYDEINRIEENKISPMFIGNLILGGKINDKINVAGHLGYGKGLIGLRVGYTF